MRPVELPIGTSQGRWDALRAAAFEPIADFGPERTAQYLHEELLRWTPILKASGLQPG